jgi:hypothetical protein
MGKRLAREECDTEILQTYEYSIAGITTIEVLYSARASFSAARPPSIVLWSLTNQ